MNGSSKAKSKLEVNLATCAASRNAGKTGGTVGGRQRQGQVSVRQENQSRRRGDPGQAGDEKELLAKALRVIGADRSKGILKNTKWLGLWKTLPM
jgi:hypothetical protein